MEVFPPGGPAPVPAPWGLRPSTAWLPEAFQPLGRPPPRGVCLRPQRPSLEKTASFIEQDPVKKPGEGVGRRRREVALAPCPVLLGAPPGKAGPAILERAPAPPPQAPPTFRWAQTVGHREPTATTGSRAELCWHAAALAGGSLWLRSAATAPAPRFPASPSPAGPPPRCTARALLSRAGWARPAAAAAPGGLPPGSGTRGHSWATQH